MEAYFIAYDEYSGSNGPKVYLVNGEMIDHNDKKVFKLEDELHWLHGGYLGEYYFALTQEELNIKLRNFMIQEVQNLTNRINNIVDKFTKQPELSYLGTLKEKKMKTFKN